MNTKYANRFDTDGSFQPICFIETEEPNYVLEAVMGVFGLVALMCFIIVVFAL